MLAALSDVLWTVGGVGFVAGMWWLAKAIDPHWVARDGRAFTCHVQPVSVGAGDRRLGGIAARTEGRWRPARAFLDDERVVLTPRGLAGGRRSREAHPVIGHPESTKRRYALFLLGGEEQFILRIPAGSKAVPVLDALCRNRPAATE